MQRGGDENGPPRRAGKKVEAELAQAKDAARRCEREGRSTPRLCRNATPSVRAPGGDRGPRGGGGEARRRARRRSGSFQRRLRGIATAVETALREERLKHNEEINALQQDHAVEFAKANRSHGNAIDAISKEYGAKIEALKKDQHADEGRDGRFGEAS